MKKTTPGAEKNPIQEITTKQELIKSNKNKYNYKLTEEDRKTIVLEYLLNKSYQNIECLANKYNISVKTIYNIVNDKRYNQVVDKYITESSNNFKKKSKILIDKALNTINQKIEEGDVSLRDLTILTGTLYDKTRLEDNLSTSNNSININIKIE